MHRTPVEQSETVDSSPGNLFDDACLVIAPIDDHIGQLYPDELRLVAGAIDKRKREFSTGRFCAHQAMNTLGHISTPLVKGAQREPVWPAGVVGSISHCRDLAGAAVADAAVLLSIGFDVENRKTLDPRIARHICTSDENAWLGGLPAEQHNLALLTIFSLKEAVFKCIYQATGLALRFQQCRVIPDLATGKADVMILHPGITFNPEHYRFRFHYNDTHVYSGMALYATVSA